MLVDVIPVPSTCKLLRPFGSALLASQTFSMPTSVTALEKEMSRRARWGQEREMSLSRESVATV